MNQGGSASAKEGAFLHASCFILHASSLMNIKPLANHLFIEASEAESMTKSGIYIPESAESKPTTGMVIAIGEGRLSEKGERIPMSVKVGDTVLYKKYGLSEVEIEGKKYMVGSEDDILAVLE